MTRWDKVRVWLAGLIGGVRPRNVAELSVGDQRLAEWLGAGAGVAGVEVTERSAFGLSAFYRGALLVAGSIAGLPLNTLRDVEGVRTQVTSLFDDPAGVIGMNPFTWKEMQVLHLLCHGDAFLYKIFNGAGALVGLRPIHPLLVSVRWDDKAVGGKRYTIPAENGKGTIDCDATEVAQIMGPSTDGLRGMSVIALARTSLGGAIAGDRAAAAVYSEGGAITGMFTPEGEPVGDDDEKIIDEYLAEKTSGAANIGRVRFINRPLKFSPMTMSLEDAQFLESRQFSVQEVARWLGVPASLLMDPGSVSTWGTGVEIQQRGLARFTLANWGGRMEEAYTRLIAGSRFVKFDLHGLERGSPAEEVALINAKVDGGLMTLNEGRKALGLAGIGPAGDILRLHGVEIGSTQTDPASTDTPATAPTQRVMVDPRALGSSPYAPTLVVPHAVLRRRQPLELTP